jgi:hypothetical protein
MFHTHLNLNLYMSRYPIHLAGFCLILIAFTCGCKTTTEITSVAPTSTGQIVGYVGLEEMDCTPSKSFAGVNVEILGTNTKAVSDSTGRFILDSVPAGYYSISFSKPGFSEYIQGRVEFVGAGILNLVVGTQLGRMRNWNTTINAPTISISSIDTTNFLIQSSSSLPLVLDSAGDTLTNVANTLLYYFGNGPSISYQDASTYFIGGFNIGNGTTTASSSFFNPRIGDTVYVVAYPPPCGLSGYTYFVGDTLKSGLPDIGPSSNTVQTVIH